MLLLHGTTLYRARQIVMAGPDPLYQEPGGQVLDVGFSCTLEEGPFHFGKPTDYAIGKAQQFPAEGGPVILSIDVPESIVLLAVSEWFPLSQGLVQFDRGSGLDELIHAWPMLRKEIRAIP